jgi:hypothetical protein
MQCGAWSVSGKRSIGVSENSERKKHNINGFMRKATLPLLMLPLLLSCNESRWVVLENRGDFERNFDTPQGAVLCLEDAYRSKDIEKIVSCKDFRLEAIYMLKWLLS